MMGMRSGSQVERVRVGTSALPGELDVPPDAGGLVMFVHGSGSSRLSARNRRVAEVLQHHRLATLLFDLLTDEEGADRRNVFDIELLSRRVEDALDWSERRTDLADWPVGLFGASTGAAAALTAAAERPARVGAVVSRGGRPDLAAASLTHVVAPTLLIVGGADTEVLELNRRALRQLACSKRLEVVPDATHLFEEPGALDSVAELAASWFERHLVVRRHT
jgi:putative phosphoribosyl transferase